MDSKLVNTGEQFSIDDFFIRVIDDLKEKFDVDMERFNIRSGQLAYDQSQISDDRVTYLAYDEQIVASVFEIRTEFNRIYYTFFKDINL